MPQLPWCLIMIKLRNGAKTCTRIKSWAATIFFYLIRMRRILWFVVNVISYITYFSYVLSMVTINLLHHSFPYLRTMSLVYQIEGYVSLITLRYCLLRSLPVKEHLLLPTITPSGFSIGTSLKINFSLNSLAGPQSLVRKSNTPFIIQEEGVSPGCTRAEIATTFFFWKCNRHW